MSRVPLIDRPWLPFVTATDVGPLAVPSPEQVRRGLRQLAEVHPGHRLVSRLDPVRGRWVPARGRNLERLIAEVVSEGPSTGDVGPEARLAETMQAFDPACPLRIIVGEQGLTVVNSHVLTDARGIVSLLAGIARCRESPDALLGLVGPSSNRGTGTALWQTFGRHPRSLISGLGADRPRPAAAVGRRAPVVADPVPGFTASRAVYRSMPPNLMAELRAERDRLYPGVTVVALLSAALGNAFAGSGLALDSEGFYLLVDLRRYVGGPGPVLANMAKSVYVRPGDISRPTAVDRSIHGTTRTGRPLLATTQAAAGHLVRRRRAPDATGTTDPGTSSVLSMSHLRSMADLDDLPWMAGPEGRRLAMINTPGSPRGITVFVANVGDVIHLTVSFNAGWVDEAAVRRAVASLGPLPVGS